MSKRNALIKQLPAIESLGQIDVLAVDKTGTLTQNEITVFGIFTQGMTYTLSGTGYTEPGGVFLNNIPVTPMEHRSLLVAGKAFALCGNARIVTDARTGKVNIAGDPTDAALVTAARKLGFIRDELIDQYELIEELPFDYKRKFHAVVYRIGNSHMLYAVGATESILALCNTPDKRAILSKASSQSKKGVRVLSYAYSEKPKKLDSKDLPTLTFGGLVLMADPLQLEVPETVASIQAAGIRVAMLTGDNAATAKAWAGKK
jgi:Ca2+-transporting ATPase